MRRDSGPAVAIAATLAAQIRPASDRRGARRRPCLPRQRPFRQALPGSGPRRRRRRDRHLRHQARSSRHRLWLYPRRRFRSTRPARCARSPLSSKSPTPPPRSASSTKAISGIPAISFSAPTSCWRSLKQFEPEMASAAAGAVEKAHSDLGFLLLDADKLCRGAEEIDRLCRDGAHRQGGGDRRRCRLVGCRPVVDGLAPQRARRRRQQPARQSRRAGRAQRSHPRRRPAHRRRRPRQCHRGDDARRRAGRRRRAMPTRSSIWSIGSKRKNGPKPASTNAPIGPGAIIRASTRARAIRSSASS